MFLKMEDNSNLHSNNSCRQNHDDEFKENVLDEVTESVLVKEINFRDYDIFTKNEKSFEITGMAMTMTGSHFVMCDHGNKSIKMMDEMFNVTCRLSSVNEPWGITAVTPTLLAVSFPFVRLLQYVKVKDESEMAFYHPILSGNEYYGIVYDSGAIAAVCKYDGITPTPSVHILNLAGSVDHVIYKTSNDIRLFENPECLAVTGHVFYVTDVDLRKVVSFNKEGTVLQTFSRPDCDPMGLSVDYINGTVYVCDKQSDCIYHLGPDLQSIDCLISKYEKTKRPLSVLFLSKVNVLVVAMDTANFIRAFQL